MKKEEEILTESIFNLTFSTEAFETQYQNELATKHSSTNTKLFKFNISFIILLITFIILHFKSAITFSIIPIYIPLALIILCRIIDKSNPNNNLVQSTSGAMYYLIYSLFLIVFRQVILHLYPINALLLVSLYYYDIISKLIIICSMLIDHNKYYSINIILFILTQGIHFTFSLKPLNHNDAAFHWLFETSLLAIEIYISYWVNRKLRYTYYSIDKVYIYHNWYRDLLNSINNSFLKLRNGKVSFCNTHFIQVLIQLGALDKENEDNMPSIMKKSDKILKAMFTVMEFNKEIIDNDTKLMNIKENFDDFKDKLLLKIKKAIFNDNDHSDLNTFIGYLNLEENASSMNYAFESYCRYSVNEFGESFEFIFNNVTRTKILEEKNAEFRVKSTFLSKVAHEFKNPLICLSEIIDEEVNSKEPSKENCLTIKSISNYLLILIKNIDLFSQMEFQHHTQSANGTDRNDNDGNKKEDINKLIKDRCCLNDIFDFITLISDYLIKKKKAEKLIKFTIINHTPIQYIDTDEVKLEQLLINLISNAIKFTYKGAIILTISEDENDYLRFEVKDSGIGIPDSFKNELFNPFSKVKKQSDPNNMLGTGLGLSISKELANALGTGLNFESTIGVGTVFWFDIKHNDAFDNETASQVSVSSLITIKDEILSPISFSTQYSPPFHRFTLLITDDDSVLRQSSIRLLKKYADIHNLTIDIIEASDGLELLWKYFENTMKDIPINIVLSDEDMFFYSGNKAAQELITLCSKIGSKPPKFYILSSNEFNDLNSKYINGYYRKPLSEENMHDIFSIDHLSFNSLCN